MSHPDRGYALRHLAWWDGAAGKAEKAPGRLRPASRTPGPLRLFPVQRLAAPSVDKRSTACLGRALVTRTMSVDTGRDIEGSPDRAPSGSRPHFRVRHPDGSCCTVRADPLGDPFTLLCFSPGGDRPALVSRRGDDVLPRTRRHPRRDGDSFEPGAPPSSRVRLRRALRSVWARGELLGPPTTAAAALSSRFTRSPRLPPLRPASLVRSRHVHRTPGPKNGQEADAISTGDPPNFREIPSATAILHRLVHRFVHRFVRPMPGQAGGC